MLDLFTASYPYTDFHEMNLDWLLAQIKKLTIDFDTFVNLNTIKYADPLLWNITRQYEKNTLVQNDIGNTFLSKKAVPVGISLENTEYWLQVADFDATANQIREYIAINEGSTTTALIDHVYNDLVWLNGVLYKVLYDISAGTAYIEDTNISRVVLADFLTPIYDASTETLKLNVKLASAVEPPAGDMHTYDGDIEAIIITEG